MNRQRVVARRLLATMVIAATLLLFWGVSLSATIGSATDAVPIVVNTTEDELNEDGDCSLREAITAANTDAVVDACPAGDGKDAIQLPAGTYTLTLIGSDEDGNATGDLDLYGLLSIMPLAGDRPVLDGAAMDRVFHVHATGIVELIGITVTNGHAPDGSAAGCGPEGALHCPGAPGGGLLNEGTLTLSDTVVIANASGGNAEGSCASGGDGGGLFNQGNLTLYNVIMRANRSGHAGESCGFGSDFGTGGNGGGLANNGTVTMSLSMVSANIAGDGGSGSFLGTAGGLGGGIHNTGTMTITASMIVSNVSGNGGHGFFSGASGGEGGGIHNTGSMTVLRSTISANTTGHGSGGRSGAGPGGHGGGLANHGSLSFVNSTISGNSTGPGGAIGHPRPYPMPGGDGAGIYNSGTLDLDNCTISKNQTPQIDPDGRGGGISNVDGVVHIKNTIVAGNLSLADDPDCNGTLTSYGYNLIGHSADCSIQGATEGNLLDQYARLAPLADYDGSTWTHALYAQSPAIDNGSCVDIGLANIEVDQRGEPRPQRVACDIGAYEAGAERFSYFYLALIINGSH